MLIQLLFSINYINLVFYNSALEKYFFFLHLFISLHSSSNLLLLLTNHKIAYNHISERLNDSLRRPEEERFGRKKILLVTRKEVINTPTRRRATNKVDLRNFSKLILDIMKNKLLKKIPENVVQNKYFYFG